MFLPVKFSDLAVSPLIASGATYNFLAVSLLPELRDLPSFVSILLCQLQVTLADGNVVQAVQLAKLALEVVDDQGAPVPGMPALEFYVQDTLPA